MTAGSIASVSSFCYLGSLVESHGGVQLSQAASALVLFQSLFEVMECSHRMQSAWSIKLWHWMFCYIWWKLGL